ncbi:hypothetical protein GCM10010168_47150 [Actinoplanes ianthinogenes]|uniref:Uncharacterized protein n=1 Tax=Actinoplanes ianthinogenes TaxID=122358 RepID=A0ABM7LNZ3_9ACTN|nr:hypothetical protein [Actinoplanes ianthinogenes]BCJ40986.1 hypothetical protein Aiant_16430 [Actinoplanes ianthinogenes]GGR23730.1 hypothetical protein GCM10010168_47150 [Actinoplanes ianthinogenes]
MKALRLLENALARLAPWYRFRARREMSVVLGPRQRVELDPATRQYAPLGIFHDRVTLSVPFAIDIDLTEIDRI